MPVEFKGHFLVYGLRIYDLSNVSTTTERRKWFPHWMNGRFDLPYFGTRPSRTLLRCYTGLKEKGTDPRPGRSRGTGGLSPGNTLLDIGLVYHV